MVLEQSRDNSTTTGVSLDISRAYRTFDGDIKAVEDVSFTVQPGQFLSLLGPSGCGKSTLLRLIAGLDRLDAGSIQIAGRPSADLPKHAGIAFVFQDAHLLPWRNVLRNVELPLELLGIGRPQRSELARQAIEEVGLSDAITRCPMQLSGGMRMRVSLARALVTRPRLLLLDEPFAALDELTRHRLDEQLLSLWQNSGMTILFVTHSILEAAFLSQRAILFSRRPARVIADIPINLGRDRSAELRTDPRLLHIMQDIQAALRAQEGENHG